VISDEFEVTCVSRDIHKGSVAAAIIQVDVAVHFSLSRRHTIHWALPRNHLRPSNFHLPNIRRGDANGDNIADLGT
jgi:hypothetical protein